MKAEVKTREPQLDIASRHELAQALRTPDPSVRSEVLQALSKMIDQALAAGKSLNQEVIDELYLRYQELEGCLDRSWYAFLLLRLESPQSLEVARIEFAATDNDKIFLLAAAQVARLSAEVRIPLLSPLVSGADSAVRCRAAANMLDDCLEHLEPATALRAALVSDHDLPVPPLNSATLKAWLGELNGPYPRSAREALTGLGGEPLAGMLSFWEQLPDRIRTWLLRAGIEHQAQGIEAKIREIIRTDESEVLLQTALECCQTLKIEDENLLTPLYRHPAPSVRAAAIAAGNTKRDWSGELCVETADEVRLAIIDRIVRCGDENDVAYLVHLLEDKSWRIRARATDALVALAPASLEDMRKALEHANEKVRVAAAQGLYRLGKEEWICQGLSG